MAGTRGWSELRGYCSSEWKADVGYLEREFEIQREIERSKSSHEAIGLNDISTGSKTKNLSRIFGKRQSPRH
jgi:hypothetical protein